MLRLYRYKRPCLAIQTTTTTPSETSMKTHAASSVFLSPTTSGKSNQAASTVKNNAPSAPAIVETTIKSSSELTATDSSTTRSCPPLRTLRPITTRLYTALVADAHRSNHA